MVRLLSTILFPVVFATPLLPRQDDPTIVTGCQTGDLTPENWVQNGIDASISGTAGFGQAAGFPRALLQNDNPRVIFDCTDLNNPTNCAIPTNFILLGDASRFSNTVCGAFGNPQLGFIGQAWVNIYTHLRNINNAAQPAVDSILNSNFVDELVTKSTSQPLPIPKSVLLRISRLSLSFVPSPVGRGLAVFRAIIPRFKQLGGKLLSNAAADQEAFEENINDQPRLLKETLASVPGSVQSNMKLQNDDIFVNSHANGDTSPIELLVGGVALSPPLSQDEYQTAMTRNLKIFTLAQLWTKISMTLLLSNPGEFGCISAGAILVGDRCMQFKYNDGVIPVTLATGENPRDASGAIRMTGLNFETVANNALDCRNSGRTFSDADFDGFLISGNDDDQAIPACLFGVPISDANN